MLVPLETGAARGVRVPSGPFAGAMVYEFHGLHTLTSVTGQVVYRFSQDESALVLVDIVFTE